MIGLALGVYGLSQGLLQIPFGLLSDRVGRKTMIVLGLILFAIGSAVAAMSTSIGGVIIGRVLQGAGAVGSVILALVADLTARKTAPRRWRWSASPSAFRSSSRWCRPGRGQFHRGRRHLLADGRAGFVGIAITLFVVPNPPARAFIAMRKPYRP